MSRDEVADFISDQRQAKTLSLLIKRLNGLVLEGDGTAQDALTHMGFTETA